MGVVELYNMQGAAFMPGSHLFIFFLDVDGNGWITDVMDDCGPPRVRS